MVGALESLTLLVEPLLVVAIEALQVAPLTVQLIVVAAQLVTNPELVPLRLTTVLPA